MYYLCFTSAPKQLLYFILFTKWGGFKFIQIKIPGKELTLQNM